MEKIIQWMGKHMDKICHFALCALIVLTVGKVVMLIGAGEATAAAIGSVLALIAGVMKELRDKRTGGIFDWGDMLADVVGILYGVFIFII